MPQKIIANSAARCYNVGMKNVLLGFILVLFLTGCSGQGMFVTLTAPVQTPTTAATVSVDRVTPTQTAPAPSPTPAPTAEQFCSVTAPLAPGTVNVRSGPGMEFEVVGVVHDGDRLRVLGSGPSGWIRIETPSGWFWSTGWCK